MQKKRVFDFVVMIERDADGWFVAKVPDIQGCATQGKSIPEVLDRVKEAIQVCVEADGLKPSDSKFVGMQTVQVKV